MTSSRLAPPTLMTILPMRSLIPATFFLACAALAASAHAAGAPAPEAAKSAAAAPTAKVASEPPVRQVLVVHTGRQGKRRVVSIRSEPSKPSFGQLIGLHQAADSLELKSGVALVMDQDTNEILFSKNSEAVLPIASLTKLMTAVVVTEAALPLDETITISDDDIDTEKGSRSRLRVGTQLRREDMLHLALMSSENRAAHALGRSYPGGLEAFVAAMNAKAHALGMHDTHYVEPTGLSSKNQSSARDLATLVKAAHEVPIIRELSTSPEYMVEVGNRSLQFRNTNGLVKSPEWDIGLQKTGYISEAGRCLVMQAKLAGRQLIMVFLDSAGKYSRIGDAERVRRWVNASFPSVPSVSGAPAVLDGATGAKPTI
jgi:serine-type D-Ala-D-Ala endopeptidase (penicillin-binding protein 7)